MEIGGIISAIIIGLIIGALGRLFAPGRQNISIIVTIIVGIAAAFLGAWIVPSDDGFSILTLIVQLVLAVIGVIIAAQLLGRRRTV
ncbi:GlsB/YeaQ/YmgE family stress response membrane protein [Cellulomonas carbonis]|uniref:Transglycosylase n=1 Tax=Cellulomonas carbonis T26 TaxID=947969 RepID=A0A0A0BXG7_9CELL|nr:hypothetical protein [Cellulomonas carbonis]KGM12382.1 transglycosylase [Cellulomonas carbonis T26]GGC03832.1 hypothetical protein GCM10010972_16160 [Cellulomonas carbonis]